jgi:hypothetical protein
MEGLKRRDFLKFSGIAGGVLFLGIDGGEVLSENEPASRRY